MKILVLNGPNLNMLGLREKNIYGSETLNDIETKLSKIAEKSKCEISFYQSNAEHELINAIHKAFKDDVNSIIFNPAGYTHTSIALRDAILELKYLFMKFIFLTLIQGKTLERDLTLVILLKKSLVAKGPMVMFLH